MAIHFTDDGNQVAGYVEFKLATRWTGFALAMLSAGNARQEFSSLVTRGLTLGIKLTLP